MGMNESLRVLSRIRDRKLADMHTELVVSREKYDEEQRDRFLKHPGVLAKVKEIVRIEKELYEFQKRLYPPENKDSYAHNSETTPGTYLQYHSFKNEQLEKGHVARKEKVISLADQTELAILKKAANAADLEVAVKAILAQ